MHECDLGYVWASPQPALWERVRAWFLAAADQAGIKTRLGPARYGVYREAGLPGPQLLFEAFAAGGPDTPARGWADVVSAAAALMEKLGVATVAEIDPPTLGDRLLAEIINCDGCVIGPPLTGAWAVRP